MRRVVFVHGYDGRGPAHYLPLFRRGASRWAAREGRPVTFGDDAVTDHVATLNIEGGSELRCSIECLRWDAYVRATVPRGWSRRLFGLRLVYDLARTGVLRRLWRVSRPLALASAAHGLFTASALLAFTCAAAAVATALGGAGAWPFSVSLGLVALACVGLAWAVTRYAGLWALEWVAAGMRHELLAERGDPLLRAAHGRALVAHLRAALADEEADEVLVVAHCSGTRLAVSILAKALRGEPTRPVRLLTLAQPSMAVMAWLPGAHRFRRDLRALAARRDLDWVDVSSPIDGSNAALLDPVRAAFGADAPGGARTFNAWFRRTLSFERYRASRADGYKTHFEFLAVPDRPDPRQFDLFDMILRPASALARFDRPEETGPFYASEPFAPWCPAGEGKAKP